jgi:hypothetical protein
MDGAERTVMSFVALGSGASGAAPATDPRGKILVTATLNGGATALLLFAPQ